MIDDTFDLLETSNDLVAHNTKKNYNMLTLIIIFMKKFKEKEKNLGLIEINVLKKAKLGETFSTYERFLKVRNISKV